MEYEALADEIESYPITRSNVKNERKDANDFITYVDSELARLGNVAIGFDYTKITYKGAFETKNANSNNATSSEVKGNKKSKGAQNR